MSIAHRILKLKGKENVSELHRETGLLYEKLSVLKFANENLEEGLPTIGVDSSFFDMLDVAFNNKISDNIEHDDKVYVNLDDVEDDGIMEPVMEKIKDIVAQMPHETRQIDAFLNQSLPEVEEKKEEKKVKDKKHDLDEMTADFKNMPVFDPVPASSQEPHKRSLNDKLKHGLHIGLNDKIAFIKHLFDGRREDYERVLSQINTSGSFAEAKNLIQNMVKPDYNSWKGKEDFEQRFMVIIEGRFNT